MFLKFLSNHTFCNISVFYTLHFNGAHESITYFVLKIERLKFHVFCNSQIIYIYNRLITLIFEIQNILLYAPIKYKLQNMCYTEIQLFYILFFN